MKDLVERFLTVLLAPLLWVIWHFRSSSFRKAAKVTMMLIQQYDRQVRIITPNARLAGFDKELDKNIITAFFKMVLPEVFCDGPPKALCEGIPSKLMDQSSTLRKDYFENKEKVDEIIEKVSSSKEVFNIILQYMLVSVFIEKWAKQKEIGAYYWRKALELDPNVKPLSKRDITELKCSVKKELARAQNIISDRNTTKIPLPSFEDLKIIFVIISPILILAGFMHNFFLLGALGMDVTKYFQLTDYLAASVNVIGYSALGSVIGLIGALTLVNIRERQSLYEQKRNRKEIVFFKATLVMVFFGSLLKAFQDYENNSELFCEDIYVALLLLGIYIASALMRYFTRPIISFFVTIFLISFLLGIWQSSFQTVYKIENYEFSKLDVYMVSLKTVLITQRLAVIAGNSSYIFFLNQERQIIIIPKEEVSQLLKI